MMTLLDRLSASGRCLRRGTCLLMPMMVAVAMARAQSVRPPPAGVNQTPAPRVITLDSAIRIALDQNTSVRLARSATVLDALSVRQLRNEFLPNLSATSQSSQGYWNGAGGRATGAQNSIGTTVGLSSAITLYYGGQNINALREAETLLRAGSQDLVRTKQTIVFTVATDFLALITQQNLLEVQRENLVAQRELLRQVEAFTTAGTHPISDLYQQQAATAAAQLAVTNATQATELAQVDLIQELVLDPRGSYEFSCPPPDSAAPPVFRLDSLISVAVAQRADVHAQALRVEAAQREILVASGGRLPVVSATIGYGTSINSGLTNGIGQQIDQQRGGAIGLGVSIPILDRGAVSITRQRDQVALDVATLALRDQTQAAALDVRRALLSYQSAQEQIIAADAQVRAGTLGLQASEARYRAGATGVTFVEVTLARATLVQAQSASVTARSNLAFQRTLMSYYTGALDFANVRIGQ